MIGRLERAWPAALALALVAVTGPGGHAQLGPMDVVNRPLWLAVGPLAVDVGEEAPGLVALGPLTISGTVHGDVTSFGGRIVLEPTAVVEGDVTSVCAPIERRDGATVLGELRANQLSETAVTDLGPVRPESVALMVGSQELTGAERKVVVVLGGDLAVRAGAQVVEIVVFGGSVQIEAGATVGVVRAIGGEVRRAEASDAVDEIIAPAWLRLPGVEAPGAGPPPGAAAGAWTTTASPTLGRTTPNLRLSLGGGERQNAYAIARAGLTTCFAELALQARAVPRYPEPGPPRRGGPLGGWWPQQPITVSRDRDPRYQRSTAVGAALAIVLTIIEHEADGEQRAQRGLQLAVPADARALTLQGGTGGQGGGGRGGGLGGGQGGGGLGGPGGYY